MRRCGGRARRPVVHRAIRQGLQAHTRTARSQKRNEREAALPALPKDMRVPLQFMCIAVVVIPEGPHTKYGRPACTPRAWRLRSLYGTARCAECSISFARSIREHAIATALHGYARSSSQIVRVAAVQDGAHVRESRARPLWLAP